MTKWGRRLLAGLLLCLASLAIGNPFGRFGFGPIPAAPGWRLEDGALRPDRQGADWLRFARPLRDVKALALSPEAATYSCRGGPGQPSKLRASLSLPAIELFFATGAELGSTFAGEPFLTWDQGSVGPGVPTPAARWVIVSYPAPQPPVLIVSLSGPVSFAWRGSPGAWRLQTDKRWGGWLRFALPQGVHVAETHSAAQLGALAVAMRDREAHWALPAPRLLGFEARDEDCGLVAVWRYDRPGAMVPPCLLLARLAGYPVEIRSAVESPRAPTQDGPAALTKEPRLVVFLPARRAPFGRAVTVGAIAEPSGPFSLTDGPLLGRLAWANLFASRSAEAASQAVGLLADYIVQAQQYVEPHTRQRVPYSAAGEGLDQAGVFAILEAALAHGESGQDPARPLRASLMWRFDPFTCSLGRPHVDRELSVALALETRSDWRALGALLYASGVARQIRPAWLVRNGLGDAPAFEACWADAWADLLYRPRRGADSLFSPLRLTGPGTLRAALDPRGARLSWTSDVRSVLWLAGPGPLSFELPPGRGSLVALQGPGDAYAYRGPAAPTDALLLWPGAWPPIPASSQMPLAPDRR